MVSEEKDGELLRKQVDSRNGFDRKAMLSEVFPEASRSGGSGGRGETEERGSHCLRREEGGDGGG